MSTPEQVAAQQAAAHGKPYPPQYQGLGEEPSLLPDVPVCAVFLLLFILTGAGHMALFRINLSRGKKFIFGGMIFGFCFTRIMATTLRIVWATHPTNVKLGLAAQICVYAGIILLFIGNLFFTQRIVRSQHPHIGWSKPSNIALPALLVIIIGSILALIVSVIYSFYTLNETTLRRVRDIQMYGETLYAIVAFLPIPIVLTSAIARRYPGIRHRKPIDKFGEGSMRAKIAIVLSVAVLLSLGASWRAATLYLRQAPAAPGEPSPWYFSKVCFYIFNFTIEIVVVLFWLAVRIDKRFIIPDGAKGPFSYAGGFTFAGEPGNEKIALGNRESMRHLTGSQPSGINGSRVSWGGSRVSMARESRVSWGGISRDDVTAGLAEDGVEVMPYEGLDEEHEYSTVADTAIDGVEAEMGWDSRTGKWALRPISTIQTAQAASTRTDV